MCLPIKSKCISTISLSIDTFSRIAAIVLQTTNQQKHNEMHALKKILLLLPRLDLQFLYRCPTNSKKAFYSVCVGRIFPWDRSYVRAPLFFVVFFPSFLVDHIVVCWWLDEGLVVLGGGRVNDAGWVTVTVTGVAWNRKIQQRSRWKHGIVLHSHRMERKAALILRAHWSTADTL